MITEELIKNIVEKVELILNENPEPLRNVNGTYRFVITDFSYTCQLDIQKGKASLKVGEQPNKRVDCTLSMSSDSFQKFLSGKLKGTVAFMTGKLKLSGDISQALKLESLLKQYTFDLS